MMYFGLAGVTKNTFEVHDIKALQGVFHESVTRAR